MSDIRQGIKAVEVAGRILEALATEEGPTTLTRLAKASGMPPSKAHRYLVSLQRSGLAIQDGITHLYALGPLATKIGLISLSNDKPLRDAAELLCKLSVDYDETFVMSVWSDQGPMILQVEESSRPIIMTMRVGAKLPMLQTATGLVFIAHLPEAFTQHLVAEELAAADGTSGPFRTSADVDAARAEVLRAGWAYNKGHLMPGISALAFPLFHRHNRLLAVLSVIGQDKLLSGPDRYPLIKGIQASIRSLPRD